MSKLSMYFELERRFARSINVERDIEDLATLDGYLVTERATDALTSIGSVLTKKGSVKAITLTGVYGTGKSAFAHFLTALCAPKHDPLRKRAQRILSEQKPSQLNVWHSNMPTVGMIRAVACAQREPLQHTIIKALARGAEQYWRQKRGPRPQVVQDLQEQAQAINEGRNPQSTPLPQQLTELVRYAQAGILVVIDELGKVLEYAATHSEDVFLLQQLAEIQPTDGHPVIVVGLLHQAFSEYAGILNKDHRMEWEKVQGRFEDLPFSEPFDQSISLISRAIRHKPAAEKLVQNYGDKWGKTLTASGIDSYLKDILKSSVIAATCPLHPLITVVLPLLCNRYAQNDRTLFTFLTSNEQHSFARYLDETPSDLNAVMSFKLHNAYDYFVEGAVSFGNKIQSHRWSEVYHAVTDAQNTSPDAIVALKTIGILNLVSSNGPFRASNDTVILALADHHTLEHERPRWNAALEELTKRGLITYRKQADEYRIWQGSDFDIDSALARIAGNEKGIAAELASLNSPRPLVAHRHSCDTGTLRIFEVQFGDQNELLHALKCRRPDADGMLINWIGESAPLSVPESTSDKKPLVLLVLHDVANIRRLGLEARRLHAITETATELQTDGVARREVRQRLQHALETLDDALTRAINSNSCDAFVSGKKMCVSPRKISALLSDVCDEQYSKGLLLNNELLNRRELTSQGAKARRELLQAILAKGDQERLGLLGDGPETSMYSSALLNTGIHRQENGRWVFGKPSAKGIEVVWNAIEEFFVGAKDQARTLQELYETLSAPPYGVKDGALPLLIAVVLLVRNDDVSIYKDGSFIPILGSEHFEILVKHPSRFSVKFFSISGLRWKTFKELQSITGADKSRLNENTRNSTILSVVKPLIRFVNTLPECTLKTKSLSKEALNVRDALQKSREPDVLLFSALPIACGVSALKGNENDDEKNCELFVGRLRNSLMELQSFHDQLLARCKDLFKCAFCPPKETDLRDEMRVRAAHLLTSCIERRMMQFLLAATAKHDTDTDWWKSVCMVVADRPILTWTDEDALIFEANLSDLARRFIHLEAIQKDIRVPKGASDARRITVTSPDGTEFNKVVWIEERHKQIARAIFNETFQHIKDMPPEAKCAVLASLAEELLSIDKPTAKADIVSHERAQKNA